MRSLAQTVLCAGICAGALAGCDSGAGADSGIGGGGAAGGPDTPVLAVPRTPGPILPDLAALAETPCKVEVTSVDLSEVISTVGIVEFTSDLAGQSAAYIEFGLTTSYGLAAPVELAGDNRTLLLGMTTDSEYHYRVLVVSDQAYCYGPDETITTGPLPAGGPSHIAPRRGASPGDKTPGFYLTSDLNGDWLYIFDQDGRIVWFYQAPFGQVSRALLSFDGSRMYARQLNVAREEVGNFFQVGMDGSSPTLIDLPYSHHDFTVTPDGTVVYLRKTPDSTCDSLYEHAADEADASLDVRLFDVEQAFPSGGAMSSLEGESCHTNSVHFNALDGGFTASDLLYNAYFKLSAAAELEWVLGSEDATLTGDGIEWFRQHGHQLLPGNVLLFFANGAIGENDSVVREVSLNLDEQTASFDSFHYFSAFESQNLGDVQRLASGNTVVTFSIQATIQELGTDARVVQTFELAGASGYACFRSTLYGPPPE